MTAPAAEDSPARRVPPPHRGLGVLGYAIAAGLLALGFVFLDSSASYEASVERPAADGTNQPTDVRLVCHSVLSGGPTGQQVDADDEVEEYLVDDQPEVLATCSRLRDQAVGRAVLVGTAGVLWALVVTAALGWAALRRQSRAV